MKDNILLWLGSVAVVLAIGICTVQASVSLGSVQIDSAKSIYAGGEVVFGVAFFNIHESEPVELKLNAEGPEGWNVRTEPESVVLVFSPLSRTPEVKRGSTLLRTKEGYINARIVHVKANVPENAGEGTYYIKLRAETVGTGNSSVTVSQTRTFRFAVNVLGKKGENRETNEGKYGEGTINTETSDNNEDVFVIEDRKDTHKNTTGNKPEGIREEGNSFMDTVTGMVTAYPIAPPVILCILVCMLIVLKAMKKI